MMEETGVLVLLSPLLFLSIVDVYQMKQDSGNVYIRVNSKGV